jgi:hypothetical protein
MIVVVGGHSRSVGKTSVMANLIRSFVEWRWTAIKITQFGHGVCSAHGEVCECSTEPDHPFALTRETAPDAGTDTARFLAAGAVESLWLRTRMGELGFGMPALRRVLAHSENVIIESNSVLQFLKPDLYLVVLDRSNPDFKTSSRLYLDRADAFLMSGMGKHSWEGVSERLLERRPTFPLGADFAIPREALDLVVSRHKVPSALHR